MRMEPIPRGCCSIFASSAAPPAWSWNCHTKTSLDTVLGLALP